MSILGVVGSFIVIGIFIYVIKRHSEIKLQRKHEKEMNEFLLEIEALKNNFIKGSHIKRFNRKFGNLFEVFSKKNSRWFMDFTVSFLSDWKKYVLDVDQHNKNYIKEELEKNESLFSNIDGKSLDSQQRHAVVLDEDNELVIAGAGSGKTLTIAGKVAYLVKRKNIDPNNILLLTFTKKAAKEMEERVVEKLGLKVAVSTFHSLGLKIIAAAQNKKPSVEINPQNIIFSYLEKEILDKPENFKKMLEFFALYSNMPQDFSKFETMGDYFSSNKHISFKSLRGIIDEYEEKRKKYIELDEEQLSKVLFLKKEIEYLNDNIENLEEEFENLRDVVTNSSKDELINLILECDEKYIGLEKKQRLIEDLKEKYSKLNEDELCDFLFDSENRTYKGEQVKSVEELIIANFLFLNGVKYQYEKPYEHDTRTQYYMQYKPDFYLEDYGIYLEHFGVDENEEPPSFFSEIEIERYKDGMKWKRQLHRDYGTKLIETYSHYQFKGKLIEKLRELLEENGVKLKSLSMEEFLVYQDQIKKREEFKEFLNIIVTFMKLFKSNGYGLLVLDEFREKASKIENKFLKERELLFFEIFEPLFIYYEKELKKNESIDFDDMIIKATELLDNVNLNYKYIIIDEYQDISHSRYRLIKSIKEKTNASIMAVGDDWQSIYRFAGSDIELFTKFDNYFGKSEIARIEKTYRNSQQIIDIAGKFVMKNPIQIKKSLKADSSVEEPVQIMGYYHNKIVCFTEALAKVLTETSKKKVLILGRNGNDIRFLEKSPYFKIFREDGVVRVKTPLYPNADIIFMTIHKSKGLEGDEVIVVNNDNRLTGFPNKIADDAILRYVLVEREEYDYGEERRLFYVALTRTKNHCILLTPIFEPSSFVEELKAEGIPYEEMEVVETVKCPRCQTGNLRIIRHEDSEFISCSHYPQCNFSTSKIEIIKKPIPCPFCGGYMVKRISKKGEFLGCINYPYCKNTQEINKEEFDEDLVVKEFKENEEIEKNEIIKETFAEELPLQRELGNLSDLSPYELGETRLKEAIPYLSKYLSTGELNEKRLAASAVSKLQKLYPNECQLLKDIILKNALECGSQVKQYNLRALRGLNLSNEDLYSLISIYSKEEKQYNKNLIKEIVEKYKKKGRINIELEDEKK